MARLSMTFRRDGNQLERSMKTIDNRFIALTVQSYLDKWPKLPEHKNNTICSVDSDLSTHDSVECGKIFIVAVMPDFGESIKLIRCYILSLAHFIYGKNPKKVSFIKDSNYKIEEGKDIVVTLHTRVKTEE